MSWHDSLLLHPFPSSIACSVVAELLIVPVAFVSNTVVLTMLLPILSLSSLDLKVTTISILKYRLNHLHGLFYCCACIVYMWVHVLEYLYILFFFFKMYAFKYLVLEVLQCRSSVFLALTGVRERFSLASFHHIDLRIRLIKVDGTTSRIFLYIGTTLSIKLGPNPFTT